MIKNRSTLTARDTARFVLDSHKTILLATGRHIFNEPLVPDVRDAVAALETIDCPMDEAAHTIDSDEDTRRAAA